MGQIEDAIQQAYGDPGEEPVSVPARRQPSAQAMAAIQQAYAEPATPSVSMSMAPNTTALPVNASLNMAPNTTQQTPDASMNIVGNTSGDPNLTQDEIDERHHLSQPVDQADAGTERTRLALRMAAMGTANPTAAEDLQRFNDLQPLADQDLANWTAKDDEIKEAHAQWDKDHQEQSLGDLAMGAVAKAGSSIGHQAATALDKIQSVSDALMSPIDPTETLHSTKPVVAGLNGNPTLADSVRQYWDYQEGTAHPLNDSFGGQVAGALSTVPETAAKMAMTGGLVKAGANAFAAGSAVFGPSAYSNSYEGALARLPANMDPVQRQQTANQAGIIGAAGSVVSQLFMGNNQIGTFGQQLVRAAMQGAGQQGVENLIGQVGNHVMFGDKISPWTVMQAAALGAGINAAVHSTLFYSRDALAESKVPPMTVDEAQDAAQRAGWPPEVVPTLMKLHDDMQAVIAGGESEADVTKSRMARGGMNAQDIKNLNDYILPYAHNVRTAGEQPDNYNTIPNSPRLADQSTAQNGDPNAPEQQPQPADQLRPAAPTEDAPPTQADAPGNAQPASAEPETAAPVQPAAGNEEPAGTAAQPGSGAEVRPGEVETRQQHMDRLLRSRIPQRDGNSHAGQTLQQSMQDSFQRGLSLDGWRQFNPPLSDFLGRAAQDLWDRAQENASPQPSPGVPGEGASPQTTTPVVEPQPQLSPPTPRKAPAPPKKFTRPDLQNRIKDLYSQQGGGVPTDVWDFLDTQQNPFTFKRGGQYAGEIRNLVGEGGNTAAVMRSKAIDFTDGNTAGGEDAIGAMRERYGDRGEDMYWQAVRERAGIGFQTALDHLRGSNDPESQLTAAIYDNLPVKAERPKGGQQVKAGADLPTWSEFELNGTPMRIEEDEDGVRVLRDGDDYPVLPVDHLPEIPVDKGTLKQTAEPDVSAFGDFHSPEAVHDALTEVGTAPDEADQGIAKLLENDAATQGQQPENSLTEHQGAGEGGNQATSGDSRSQPVSGKPPAFFDADEAGVSAQKPGLFGQPTFDASTGNQQGSMFHEPVRVDRPEGEKLGSKNANDPKNTGEMFPAGDEPRLAVGDENEQGQGGASGVGRTETDLRQNEAGSKEPGQAAAQGEAPAAKYRADPTAGDRKRDLAQLQHRFPDASIKPTEGGWAINHGDGTQSHVVYTSHVVGELDLTPAQLFKAKWASLAKGRGNQFVDAQGQQFQLPVMQDQLTPPQRQAIEQLPVLGASHKGNMFIRPGGNVAVLDEEMYHNKASRLAERDPAAYQQLIGPFKKPGMSWIQAEELAFQDVRNDPKLNGSRIARTDEGTSGKGQGEKQITRGAVAGETGASGNEETNPVRSGDRKSAGGEVASRVPRGTVRVNRLIDRISSSQHADQKYSEYLDELNKQIADIGAGKALEALGRERPTVGGALYHGADSDDIDQIEQAYLEQHGVQLVGNEFTPEQETQLNQKPFFTIFPKPHDQLAEADHDYIPKPPAFKNKLEEANLLPATKGTLPLRNVTHLTPRVMDKLDKHFGTGKWVVKMEEGWNSKGIFFPDYAAKVRTDALLYLDEIPKRLEKVGFVRHVDSDGYINGIRNVKTGQIHSYGEPSWDKAPARARRLGNIYNWAVRNSMGAELPNGGEKMMAQPAIETIGGDKEWREAGGTIVPGEYRVHLMTKDGEVYKIPYATRAKDEDFPVVFPTKDSTAAEEAAIAEVRALAKQHRNGQLYGMDMIPTRTGYTTIETNPSEYTDDGESTQKGASGWLQSDRFTIDALVSHLLGRDPAHVSFIRRVLGKSDPLPTSSTPRLSLGNDLYGPGSVVGDDVLPAVKGVTGGLAQFVHQVRSTLAPQTRGESGRVIANMIRDMNARIAITNDRNWARFRKASALFDGISKQQSIDFVDKVEREESTGDPSLDMIGKALVRLEKQAGEAYRAAAPGKLRSLITDKQYLGRSWKDPTEAAGFFENLFAKRPLEGKKSFTKHRSIDYFIDGIKGGLEPVTYNPVDMAMLRTAEMTRATETAKLLTEMHNAGLRQYVGVNDEPPATWETVDDPAFKVYGPPGVTAEESFDKGVREPLLKLAESLGATHARVLSLKGGARGLYHTGPEHIDTKYGTMDQVIAHELGHHLGKKFNVIQRMLRDDDPAIKTKTGQQKMRGKLAKQMRAVADLRYEHTPTAPDAYKDYVREKAEKEAALLQAWIQARDKFRDVAPDLYNRWVRFLNSEPKLKPLLDIQPSIDMDDASYEIPHGGLLTMGHYYVPPEGAQLFRNMLSPGVRAKSGFVRGLFTLNNVMNQANLSFSAFHATGSAINAAVSDLAVGLQRFTDGDFTGSIAPILRSLTGVGSAAQYLREGGKMLQEWYKPGTSGGDIAKMVQAVITAGGRPGMDSALQANGMRAFMKQIRQIGAEPGAAGKLNPFAKALLRLPPAVMDAASAPIMKYMIPRLKFGAFAQLARLEMARLGPNADKHELRAALAKAWDSIDNRFGQLVHDNMFWHPIARDLAMLSTRSVGWNVGDFREFGNAVADTVKQTARTVGGKRSRLTAPMAFAAALLVYVGGLGALIHFLMSGKKPKDFKDYYYPQTGELGPDGKPIRLGLPTYMKDVYGMYKQPLTTIKHKASPLLGALADVIENKDYFGNQVRDPKKGIGGQAMDSAKHLARASAPFSIQQMNNLTEKGASLPSKAMAGAGFTQASKRIDDTPAEEKAREIKERHEQVQGRSTEQADKAALKWKIADDMRKDSKSGFDELSHAIQAGQLSKKDATDIKNNVGMTGLQSHVHRMSAEEGMEVWQVADDEEREKLREMLFGKVSRSETMTFDQKKAAIDELKAGMRKAG